MAEKRQTIEPPKPIELLGSFVGYFAVAKDVPVVFRTLCIHKLVPLGIKTRLLSVNGSTDFWLLLGFTLATILFLSLILYRGRQEPENENSDPVAKAVAKMESQQTMRIIRSLGVVFIREKLLDQIGVRFYGTFKRPSSWLLIPERFPYVDRITIFDGTGIEFQYMKNFRYICFRKHPENDFNYGETQTRKPTFNEIVLLCLASNWFPFWLPLHLIQRPFYKV